MLEVSALLGEKVAQKKEVEELSWRLEGKLAARKRKVADKRGTVDAVVAMEKLNEQVKQLSASVLNLKGEVVIGNAAVADLIVKLNAAKKRAKDVVYSMTVCKLAYSSCNADRTRWVKESPAVKVQSIASVLK